ncbi:MAG TPA: DUF488 domain-containing protein [Acidimicrobiales bacterium]|nr:DUF488 domain-containing protein [Acidimicrobiales bacterium]
MKICFRPDRFSRLWLTDATQAGIFEKGEPGIDKSDRPGYGHGTLAEAELIELLRQVGVVRLVDVRSFPGSRRNPQYAREQLEHWLPAAGIAYSWEPRLGGRRRPDPASPHVAAP